MKRRSRTAIALFVAILALASSVSAQIVAPVIEKRAVEFGLAYKWFDRDLDSGPISEMQWEVATFYGRYGAFDRVTLTAEGGVWDVENDDFHATYRRWTMGGGVAVSVIDREPWEIALGAHYQTVWDNDVSSVDFDKRTYGINVEALLAYRFTPAGQTVRIWAGPTYVDDVAENYPWGTTEPLTHDPEQDWGAVVGAEGVAWKHVSVLAYAIFLDNPQWRIGLAWRIEGEP